MPLLATLAPGLPFESIEMVLRAGAHPLGREILFNAAEGMRKDILDLALELGADVNFPQDEAYRTALFSTAENCSLDVAKYFVEKGAKIDGLPESTATPLFSSALVGKKFGVKCVKYCKYLLDQGADVSRYSSFYVDEHKGSHEVRFAPLPSILLETDINGSFR